MNNINFKTENIVVEDQRLVLIRAVADCNDVRTGRTVQLSFFFLKNIAPADVNSNEVKALINLTIMRLGFELERLNTYESQPIWLNAEKMWKEEHEQKSFQF